MQRAHRRIIAEPSRGSALGVVAIAAVIRLAFIAFALSLAGSSWVVFSDSGRYIDLARSLVTEGTFSLDGSPEIFRMPIYPALLAVGLATGRLIAFAVAVQVLASSATVWLVYRLMASTGDARSARIAALITALDPMLVIYTPLVLPETVFTLLVTAAVVAVVTGRSWGSLGLGGLLAGAAALVRPIAYLLPLALAAGVVVGRDRSWRDRLRAGMPIVLGATLLIGAWHVRNLTVAGYGGFSSQLDRSLFFTLAGSDMAAASQRDFFEVRDELRVSVLAQIPADGQDREAALARASRQQGLDYLKEHWWSAAARHLRGSLQTLVQPPGGELFGLLALPEPPAATSTGQLLTGRIAEGFGHLSRYDRTGVMLYAARGIYWMAMLVLIAWGTVWIVAHRTRPSQMAGANRRSPLWPVVLAVVGYLAVVSGTDFGQARFRHPMMPLLSLPAAIAFVQLRRRVKRAE